MHLIRFLTALLLAEVVVLAGVALERQKLFLRAEITEQSAQIRRAQQAQQRIQLKIDQLASAPRILQRLEQSSAAVDKPANAEKKPRARPKRRKK